MAFFGGLLVGVILTFLLDYLEVFQVSELTKDIREN